MVNLNIFYALGSILAVILTVLKIWELINNRPRVSFEIIDKSAEIGEGDYATSRKESPLLDYGTNIHLKLKVFNKGAKKAIIKGIFLDIKKKNNKKIKKLKWIPYGKDQIIDQEPITLNPNFDIRGVLHQEDKLKVKIKFLNHRAMSKKFSIPSAWIRDTTAPDYSEFED